jgi:hypothetical protein
MLPSRLLVLFPALRRMGLGLGLEPGLELRDDDDDDGGDGGVAADATA